jgi:hypothetical protein
MTRTQMSFRLLLTSLAAVAVLLCSSVAEETRHEPATEEENPYWEKTKELYRQSLEQLDEHFLRSDTNATWMLVHDLYKRAKESGEGVPADINDWVKQDIQKIGAWDYKIVTVDTNDPNAITEKLNALGRDRWECYWLENTETGKRCYLKKSARSYLRLIPAGDLLKLIPKDAEG